MDFQVAVILDETRLPEFVHEETHARPSGARVMLGGKAVENSEHRYQPRALRALLASVCIKGMH
jgi:hypothetical protein